MAPLLQPTECCMLLIDPTQRNVSGLEQHRQQGVIRRYSLIERAANAVAVPRYFAINGELEARESWLAQPCERAKPRVYRVGAGSSWSTSGLSTALTSEKRPCLVLCGFWLETVLTFCALNALGDGFDVFVVVDASPSSGDDVHAPALSRLVQAGVVPLTTVQMVREWAEVVADNEQRQQLLDFLATS